MRRQILTDDNRAVQVLRTPYYYQSNSDWLCFVFSLKMCLEYFKNIYRNEFVRNSTPNLSIDELKQLTYSGEFTGTRIDNALMNELTRKTPSINFTLNEECSIDHLKRNFKNCLPTIVLYNCSYMLYEEPGPGHAGVVIGIIEDNDLILNNLVEIETTYQTLPEKISNSMSFFFEKGYASIDSIKQVVGLHLTITGFCYETALEYGGPVPIDYGAIKRMIADVYRQEVKRFKLPRYLIQLESVGLLEETTISGKTVWQGKGDIFDKIQGEEEILQPVRKFLA